jgi:hypothetical protein
MHCGSDMVTGYTQQNRNIKIKGKMLPLCNIFLFKDDGKLGFYIININVNACSDF